VRGLTVVNSRDLKCNCCGVCCRTYSKVDVSITDIFNMAAYIGIGAEEFVSRYCKTLSDGTDSSVFLLDIEGGCKFHKDNKCTIYPVRTDMCAMYPFNLMCLNTSQSLKKDLARFDRCFEHSLPDNLVIVPDLERMVDSRIMFMVKEMYMARFGGDFREADAIEYHKKGLAQVQNDRMRSIVHMQLLNEFLKAPPLDEATKKPLLSAEEIRRIYNKAKGMPRTP
jgi:Fe-S-cluster containining protein